MDGETFCLRSTQPKRFLYKPEKVLRVYGYLDDGSLIEYKTGHDYIINYNKGTIQRLNGSRIPDYSSHKVRINGNGKFTFCENPRNPELNVLYQVHVDYRYKILEDYSIVDSSNFMSDKTIQKLLNHDEIKILVAGDSISAGAQTTSRLFRNNAIGNSYIGKLKNDIQKVFNNSVDVDLLAIDGSDRYYLKENLNEVTKSNADIVFIEFGMNDHCISGALSDDLKYSFYNDIKNITMSIKESGKDVVIIGFFQQNDRWDQENAKATFEYNALLHNVADETNTFFADVYPIFNKVSKKKSLYEDVTADYMHHPSDWGGWFI